MPRKNKNANKVINMQDARKATVPTFAKRKHNVEIIPRNTAQEFYLDNLTDRSVKINFAVGPAGTGKTLLCVLRAIELYKDGEIDKIVITRPAVGVEGENHGFLPGDLNAKMDPWVRPIMDIFEEYYTPLEIAQMLEEHVIEIAPLMYMRGRTFKNCYIIADEMQNATPEQMKMLLTRIGSGTQMAITGDLDQTDHRKQNGLGDISDRLSSVKDLPHGFGYCEFGVEHIEREEIVKTVLSLYD